MGFYLTGRASLPRSEAGCERREKTHPPSKNRVWDFFATSLTCAGQNVAFAQYPRPGNEPTPTATASGARYYGYRFYSPRLGRWISKDPMGEIGSVNLYCFVENAALNHFDALGLVGEGIIAIGEIPGIAEKLNVLHARLLNKAVKVSGGTADKTKFTSWLGKVGPEVFVQLYAQALYDELQERLEGPVRNIGVCHVVNLEYAGSGRETGEIEVKEYSFPSFTKPWTWTTAPTVKRAMKYEPCPNNCNWRVYYYMPLSKDFTSWKEVERFSCSGEPKCRKSF